MKTKMLPSSFSMLTLFVFQFITLSNLFKTIQCNELIRKYDLYHDLGNGFVRRNAYIELIAKSDTMDETKENSNYIISASMKKYSDDDDDDDDSKMESCSSDDDDDDETCNPMSMEEKAILELIMENKFYRIKTVDVETGMESVTSAHPCSIRKANFRESMNLILSHKADLLSMDYNPIISPILSTVSCQSFLSYQKSNTSPNLKFQTTSITYTTSTPAMTIPTILPSVNLPKGSIKMLPRDKTKARNAADSSTFTDTLFQNENEQSNQNQSFLRRYWYIFLPMMIMSLFGADPEEQQQGQQGQGNRSGENTSAGGGGGSVASAGATATATAVGTSTVGSSTRKRRGKRS